MTKERLNQLIEKLGMGVELQPLLDSDSEAYTRFEKAVNDTLNKYKNVRPRARIQRRVRQYQPISPAAASYSVLVTGKLPFYPKPKYADANFLVSPRDYQTFIDAFRRNYGIGCEPESLRQIGESENRSAGRLGQKVNFIIELLKQKHKRDLWYGAL